MVFSIKSINFHVKCFLLVHVKTRQYVVLAIKVITIEGFKKKKEDLRIQTHSIACGMEHMCSEVIRRVLRSNWIREGLKVIKLCFIDDWHSPTRTSSPLKFDAPSCLGRKKKKRLLFSETPLQLSFCPCQA